MNVIDLALLGGEPEEIDIARFVNHTVECDRRRHGLVGLCNGIVWFLLNDVTKVGETEANARRRNTSCVLAESRERLLRHRGGELDLLLDRTGGVANESDFHFFAELAAGGHHGRRTREGADVQAILASAVATIRAFVNFDD